MITRRNWLLKCSILVNIAVLLYICSHVMVGNNTNNFGMSGGSGSSSYLIQLSPTSHQQSTQQQKSSLSPAQQLQDEQEIAAILRNKELELQKQIHMQEAALVRIPTVNDDPVHVMSLCRACNSISCELIASLNIAHYIVTWAERESPRRHLGFPRQCRTRTSRVRDEIPSYRRPCASLIKLRLSAADRLHWNWSTPATACWFIDSPWAELRLRVRTRNDKCAKLI